VTHLWEVHHPFYGNSGGNNDGDLESFAELRELLDGHADDGSTVIYRWDWSGPHTPDAFPDTPEELEVFGLYPRTGQCWSARCPIGKDQEQEVLEWLRGPRMLGALQKLWAPVLDLQAAPDTDTLPEA